MGLNHNGVFAPSQCMSRQVNPFPPDITLCQKDSAKTAHFFLLGILTYKVRTKWTAKMCLKMRPIWEFLRIVFVILFITNSYCKPNVDAAILRPRKLYLWCKEGRRWNGEERVSQRFLNLNPLIVEMRNVIFPLQTNLR